jgi:hypothetical protein
MPKPLQKIHIRLQYKNDKTIGHIITAKDRSIPKKSHSEKEEVETNH